MISCSKCGRSLPDHAKFCSGCGTPVLAYDDAPKPAFTCISCGAALKPEAQFCPVCGTKQIVDEPIIRDDFLPLSEPAEERDAVPEPWREIHTPPFLRDDFLPPSEPPAESYAVPDSEEEVYVCSNSSCGVQLPDGARFCRKCGSPAIKVPVKKVTEIPGPVMVEPEVIPTLHGDLSDTEKGSSGTRPERGFFSEAGDL